MFSRVEGLLATKNDPNPNLYTPEASLELSSSAAPLWLLPVHTPPNTTGPLVCLSVYSLRQVMINLVLSSD